MQSSSLVLGEEFRVRAVKLGCTLNPFPLEPHSIHYRYGEFSHSELSRW